MASVYPEMKALCPCDSCRKLPLNERLFQLHITSWADVRGSQGLSSLSLKVCAHCLVQHNVPVLRQSTGDWEIGQVQAYDSKQEKHQIVFLDDQIECVSVSENPFALYAQHHISEAVHPPSLKSPTQSFFFTSGSPAWTETEYQKKRALQFDRDTGHSQITMVSSNRTIDVSSLKDNLFSIKSPPRPASPANRKSGSHKTIHFGTPNSTVSALSSGSAAGTKSSRGTKSSSDSSKTRTLKLWTIEEDRALLDTIAANNNELVWPKIASSVPGRTGKQCRERYLNHLTPSLKQTGWSVLEDATIFRLYSLHGSKWSRMVKHLKGRTDNGIKNRYHHINRRFERNMRSVKSSKELDKLMKKIQDSRLFKGDRVDPLLLKYLSLRLLERSKSQSSPETHEQYKLGPYYFVNKRIGCKRCGLVMPSVQTGRYVCAKTGWCQTCCGMSPIATGDALRVTHIVDNGGNSQK